MKSKLFCFCLIFLLPVSVFALEGYKDLKFGMKKNDVKRVLKSRCDEVKEGFLGLKGIGCYKIIGKKRDVSFIISPKILKKEKIQVLPTLKVIYIDFLGNETFNKTVWGTLNKSLGKKYTLYNHGKPKDDTYVRAYAKGSVVTILRTVESSVHFDLESISYSISPESVGTSLLMYQEKNYAETFLEEKGLIKGDSDEI